MAAAVSEPPADYYAVLGVARTATEAEIKQAYLRQARRWHPDKNDPSRKDECERMFKAVAEAYSTLRDPAKRAEYDAGGGSSGGGRRAWHGSADAFTFREADAMFREFFSTMRSFGGADLGSPFGAFGGSASDGMPSGYGRRGRGGDPFADMFRAMDSMMDHMRDIRVPEDGPWLSGASSSSTSATFATGAAGGAAGGGAIVGRSSRTETVVRNGRRVTRTVQTVQYADGRTETTSDEHEDTVSPGDPLFLPGFGGSASDPAGGRRGRLGWM